MQAFISISKISFLVSLILLSAAPARAVDNSPVDEEDYTQTPFTEYGQFNEDAEEEADARFFQHGRFFGISLGIGASTVDGNRGLLWRGGFPMFDFKIHYWFDFNIALTLNFSTASHYFDTSTDIKHADVNLTRAGIDLRYYFDTKNLAAPISYANPFLVLGFANTSKTESSFNQENVEATSALGLNAGGGLEFAIKPRKVYFQLEGKIHLLTFPDTYTEDFKHDTLPLDDLTGNFYTFVGSFLFTW